MTFPTSSWTPVSEVTCRFAQSMRPLQASLSVERRDYIDSYPCHPMHFAAEAHERSLQTPFLPGGPGATQASNGEGIVPAAHTYYSDAASFTLSSMDPAVYFTGGTSVMGLSQPRDGDPAGHEAPSRFDGGGGGDDGGGSSGGWICPPRAWLDGSGAGPAVQSSTLGQAGSFPEPRCGKEGGPSRQGDGGPWSRAGSALLRAQLRAGACLNVKGMKRRRGCGELLVPGRRRISRP